MVISAMSAVIVTLAQRCGLFLPHKGRIWVEGKLLGIIWVLVSPVIPTDACVGFARLRNSSTTLFSSLGKGLQIADLSEGALMSLWD